jgi:hypothetical protein
MFSLRIGFYSLFLVCLITAGESAAAVYTLTANVNGSGTVSRNPTNSVYPEGAVVTLTANSDSGWFFASWSGDASGSTNPLNVMINSNKVITANFQLIPSFTLTTSVSGQGTVALDPASGTYLSNSVVSATATPAAGWVFVNWSGGASGSANPVSVTVNANKSITAVFAQLAAIDVAPQDQIAGLGDTVIFSGHAQGTAPLFYQWQFNSLALAGATNATLTLTNIQSNQEGNYALTVTNAYGSDAKPASLTITNACSGTNVVTTASEAELRTAMALGGVVRLCFNGTITLANTITISNDVTLDAHDRIVVISGNNTVRLFSVSPGVTVAATNLILANGRNVGQAGANSSVENGQSGFPGEGGAILNDGGTVVLVSCLLTNNSVTGGMAGAGFHNGIGGEGRGGAILNRGGSLSLYSVNMFSNSASGGLGVPGTSGTQTDTGGNALGGALYSTNGSLLIANCNLSENICTAPGGGDFGAAALGGAVFQASGSVTISNSVLAANLASGADSPFGPTVGFPSPSSAYGGAIAAVSGTVIIERSQLSANTARGGNAFRYSGTGEAQGGAIFSAGTLLSLDSTFSGNQALSGNYSDVNTDGRGGALYNTGSAALNRCSFYSNYAQGGTAGAFGTPSVNYPGGDGLGGGIFNLSQLAMTNCTLALNNAQGGNGGVPNGVPGSGLGGGIYNSNGVFTAMNITVASNSVTRGVGINYQGTGAGANVANTNGVFSLRNSLIAYGGTNGNAYGTISDAGFNISSDGSANFNSGSSFNFTDPRLNVLGDYGGPTFTMALRTNSPAVDFGSATGAPATDQRGFIRPAGLGVDMGAYELQTSPSQLPLLAISREESGLQLSFQAEATIIYHLQSSTNLANWVEIELIGPFPSASNVIRTISPVGQPPQFFRLFIP